MIATKEAGSQQTQGEQQPGTQSRPRSEPGPSMAFRAWFWALVPFLAIVAYISAARVGFLVDDLPYVSDARKYGFDLARLLDEDARIVYGQFYRPVGILLTWRLGWYLWGADPLPYHLQSVLIHALVALLAGLWVAQASRRRSLGWLAGALFGVWPLHMEAVAWLSAQWDALAVLFGMASLLLFTRWWGAPRPNHLVYVGSLALYAVALLTKESMLPFIAMFAFAAWCVTPRFNKQAFRRLSLSLGPFFLALLGFLGLRFALWGQLGGYEWAPTDFGAFLWDRLIEAARLLVAPINPAVVGVAFAQLAGVAASMLLLGGLVAYGYRERRLLLVSGLWTLLAVIPGLNLRVSIHDMHNNRFLYLAAVGYCMGVATLIYTAITSLSNASLRRGATILVGGLLVACCALTWVHLRPWHTLTVMIAELDKRMLDLMPPRQGGALIWFVENRPLMYKGAHGPSLDLGYSRGEMNGDIPNTVDVRSAVDAVQDVANYGGDAFTMRFAPVFSDPHFKIDFLAGITNETEAPTASGGGTNLTVWDFTGCDSAVLSTWSIIQAEAGCVPGTGLKLQSQTNDAQMLSPEVAVGPVGPDGVVRLRAAMRYAQGDPSYQTVAQWFWAQEAGGFREDRSRSMQARQGGNSHVYWTFLQAPEVEGGVKQLRFDPLQHPGEVEIRWLAIDVVP